MIFCHMFFLNFSGVGVGMDLEQNSTVTKADQF